MKYFQSLSQHLNADIYVCNQGIVYANTANGMNRIGDVTNSIYELMENI